VSVKNNKILPFPETMQGTVYKPARSQRKKNRSKCLQKKKPSMK
jgi:hypothetical protein